MLGLLSAASISLAFHLDATARDDMIYDALKAATDLGASVAHDKDEDLPGMGQHYCVHCE